MASLFTFLQTEDDLKNLIGTSNENQAIDFKEFAYPPPPEDKLPSNQAERSKIQNKWKLDLCKDISAFANASGGSIICGMVEKGGVATELCGLGKDVNAERRIADLEQVANTGIEPVVPGLSFDVIPLKDLDAAKVIVIRIARSFAAPHRVRETSKFHVRRSGRNDEMNVDELRRAFNLSATLTEHIKGFRHERIEALSQEDGHEDVPVVLEPGVRLVLHVVPLNFSESNSSVEFKDFRFIDEAFDNNYSHMNIFKTNMRFNFDGLLLPYIHNEGKAIEYFQLFRSGAIEYVSVGHSHVSPQEKLINPYGIEEDTLWSLQVALKMQQSLGIEAPLVILVSLLGITDHRFELSGRAKRSNPINKQRILIPDVVLQSFEEDFKKTLHPVFDTFWNTGGISSSPKYDKNTGEWTGRPIDRY